MELIADTTFLIGLWRRQPWAMAYAGRNAGRSIGLPWIVLGEFWHGAIKAGHDTEKVAGFLQVGMPITDTAPVLEVYARICVKLQGSGTYRMIGQNDLWIAAVAISCGLPLVTRNSRHFGLIEGLKIEVLES
jgi:predicted nucleic acid-binding protein